MSRRSNAYQPPVATIGSILLSRLAWWIGDRPVFCLSAALAAFFWMGLCTGRAL